MYYILDGYNLFFHLYEDNPTEYRKQLFVNMLCTLMKEAKKHGEMIFDTPIDHQTVYPHTQVNPPLIISYAPNNLEADDLIIEKLYAIKNRNIVCIVTSDRELIQRARSESVKFLKCDTFIKMLKKHKPKKQRETKPEIESPRQQDRLEKIFNKKLEDANE